jgi:hypothetical protein
MPAREVINARQYEAVGKLVHDVIEKYEPETARQLALLTLSTTLPNTSKHPDLYAVYLTEAIIALAKQVDELRGKLEEVKPKRGPPLYKQVDELREELEEFKPRRGRPPKSS